ncbi:hypothetical protein [Streptosporangium subroseum]|uniref:hypothetical protein n=1 Tax=Streptosporangium subroseum TaxID=106412 RepID=UPI001C531AB9|nr:hypothetical protein [Streptosporangium subroseum]
MTVPVSESVAVPISGSLVVPDSGPVTVPDLDLAAVPVAEAGSAPVAVAPVGIEFVIVADPADKVAAELAAYVREHGRTAAVLDVFEAAQLFTLSVIGGRATVEPVLPMILRLPAPPVLRTDVDAEFQFNECLAQLWAVAALSPAPVVNRPSAHSLGGQVSYSAALTAMRAGVHDGSAEVFASTYPEPGVPEGDRWWVQDTGTLTTSPWPERPVGEGPYRGRWSDSDPAFEIVVVLEGRAWRCTTADLEHLDLEGRSLAVSARLGLTLTAVTWRVTADAEDALLVNVEPYPGLEELRMVWLGFGPHLMKLLFP